VTRHDSCHKLVTYATVKVIQLYVIWKNIEGSGIIILYNIFITCFIDRLVLVSHRPPASIYKVNILY